VFRHRSHPQHDVRTFTTWNPSVNSACSNTLVGDSYCVKPTIAVAAAAKRLRRAGAQEEGVEVEMMPTLRRAQGLPPKFFGKYMHHDDSVVGGGFPLAD